MPDRIAAINDEFFGEDRSRNYLKDDYNKVLQGIVLRSILVAILRNLSEKRSNVRKLPDGGTAYGDFDPDNAGFFANLFSGYQRGWMTDVRMFLGGKKHKARGGREAGSGGKFIDEITSLTYQDFIDYYTTPKNPLIPRCLLVEFYEQTSKDGRIFLEANKNTLETITNDLVDKAKRFQNKDYHSVIIRDYEALELHKDNRPEKYDIREESTDFPFSNGSMTARSPKSKIEIHHIAMCLNEFAEIIKTYQLLVGGNTSFTGSHWPLDIFISRTLSLFAKDLPEGTTAKLCEDVVKYLHPAIDIVDWRHEPSGK